MYNEYLKEIPGPSSVYLDLYSQMLMLYRALSFIDEFDPDFDFDLNLEMTLLFDMIKNKETAKEGALHYVSTQLLSLKNNHHTEQAKALEEPLTKLATDLAWQMVHFGLYTHNDTLPYEFYGWLDPFTPVIMKSLETDAFVMD